jgi:hypothetical protein
LCGVTHRINLIVVRISYVTLGTECTDLIIADDEVITYDVDLCVYVAITFSVNLGVTSFSTASIYGLLNVTRIYVTLGTTCSNLFIVAISVTYSTITLVLCTRDTYFF